ncbi:hypothetical protein cym2001_49190 [Pseudomonas sp. CYM-20-01]|uniref:hypothetical protein n=1 Tax=Pseudomonas sp. CYM-20-01 TaxID=2870750 RepID=UPI00205B5DD4|nr:hypothetical protein [Pseudomonas sp. CYM-20-01]BDB21554.1 hypothetical protein cym2001_49190 [Pseudomonas sp. CYM-20-01]
MTANTKPISASFITNKTPKATGHFQVSKSPQGSFTTDTVFLSQTEQYNIVECFIKWPNGEEVIISLIVEKIPGESNGTFLGAGIRPWSTYNAKDANGNGTFYWSDQGSYSIVYIPNTKHVTGSVTSISIRDGEEVEVKYVFNVSV